MQPYLLPTFSVTVLIITSLAFVHIPKSFSQDQLYVACRERFGCGSLSFSYPFWGGNRPSSCGRPRFELTCQSGVALLTFDPLAYRVLAIDSSQRYLTVARDDLWSSPCTRLVYNDTFDAKLFSYSTAHKNVTLSYRCTILNRIPRQQNQFDCPANTTTNTTRSTPCFYSTDTLGIDSTDIECDTNISVSVNQVAYQNLGFSESLQAALNGGFGIQWKRNNSVCDRCTRSGGSCGYNWNTSSFACYCSDRPYELTCKNTRDGNNTRDPCADRPYDLTCNNTQDHNNTRDPCFDRPYDLTCNNTRDPYGPRNGPSRLTLALGISFGTIGLILSVAGVCYLVRRCLSRKGMWKPDKENNQNIEAFIRNYGSLAPKFYSFSEIKRMTDSFAHRLGQGGYGSVYKGKLSDGREVAVKVLRDNKGNGEEFINEVASISRTSHVNVVNLLGFCCKANRRALVYEFMSNGSLDKFICKNDQDADCRLGWNVLYQIAVGAARGLEYLHQGCNTRIVHFDIKPHNILLDRDFCPKISDFGLAKLCKTKQSILSTMGARGTVGYIAPEIVFRGLGGASHRSDVYSYGMMVLEMVGLKSRIQVGTERSSEAYFPDWIYERLELQKDLGLEGVMNVEEEEAARKMILVGLWCIQTKPSDRPSMSKVVEMLEGSIQSLQIPPKPYLLDSPAAIRSFQESSGESLS